MSASELLPLVIAVGGFLFGFFTAALMASRAKERTERRAFWQGFEACNRQHAGDRCGHL